MLGLASAAPTTLVTRLNQVMGPKKLIVGAPGQILGYEFNNATFKQTANSSAAGTSASWMAFKAPNLLYAVDENSNTTRLFTFDPSTNTLSTEPVSTGIGAPGIVTLEFNADKTHLLAGSYTLGQVDIWDISAANGSFGNAPIKSVVLDGPVNSAGVHRAHQIVREPSGRYYAVADLGGDAIHIIDGKDNKYDMVVKADLSKKDVGPRHGGWITTKENGGLPTHYIVVTETSSEMFLFEVVTADGAITGMTEVQSLSTFGAAFPPANATAARAGELVVANNNRDIYVSNRLTGNETDSISHFIVDAANDTGKANIVFAHSYSSGGSLPRMFSLSGDADQSILFSSNQLNGSALVAFTRGKCGGLTAAPLATLDQSLVSVADAFGPQFVMEIPTDGEACDAE
ncbi:putative isomerase YbhE [Pleomassaria siparia CBS 279.74]|uniref:Putative isomerase YbhE n=1 Tax=Pleomassaria siparia CBS 279.74 TaxID=1314801 RepID=A0A6G1K9W2_9PLEO|nr:putative isomerase YbhE [Pleomassaria siparia CBS 279.74]